MASEITLIHPDGGVITTTADMAGMYRSQGWTEAPAPAKTKGKESDGTE